MTHATLGETDVDLEHGPNGADALVLDTYSAALVDDGDRTGRLHGALQITLNADGVLSVRGPRRAVAWWITVLARQGWRLDFDALEWCG